MNMLPKIDYTVLKDAATSLGYTELPPLGEVTEELKMNEEFKRKVHRALLDIHVIDGQLVCPETGRPFPITGGIPNMLLHEDEV